MSKLLPITLDYEIPTNVRCENLEDIDLYALSVYLNVNSVGVLYSGSEIHLEEEKGVRILLHKYATLEEIFDNLGDSFGVPKYIENYKPTNYYGKFNEYIHHEIKRKKVFKIKLGDN